MLWFCRFGFALIAVEIFDIVHSFDVVDSFGIFVLGRSLAVFVDFDFGAEGFAFAALMSVTNVATPLADTSGAYLYDHVFDGRLAPLIVVSAAFTAFVLVLIPLFRIERA